MKYYNGFSFENNQKGQAAQKQELKEQEASKPDVEKYIKVKEHKAKIKRSIAVASLLTAFLFTGFGLGIHSYGYFLDRSEKTAADLQLQTDGTQASLPNLLEGNSISGIVERTGGAVVAIETESKLQNSGAGSPEQFWRYFGRMPNQQQTVQGLGSGFIISTDGYVLTNNHVVEGASSIKVKLLGIKEPLTARIIGTDSQLDLAVLKIDASQNFPVIPIGNSDEISVGDWVVAIGNPYGLDHTVTMGVISAKGRPLNIEGNQFTNLLQTDASINPGNSGGPLLNLNGEVIGINTAITSEGQGLGFAIPINTVQEVLQELIKQGKVSRPWLGVSIMDMTQEIADYLKTENIKGVVIAEVISGSPAQQAGLQQGDIIVAINNEKVSKSEEVTGLISGSKIGATIELQIIRNKVAQSISVTLAEK